MARRFDIGWVVVLGLACAACLIMAVTQKNNGDYVRDAWFCGLYFLWSLGDLFAARPRMRLVAWGATGLLLVVGIGWVGLKFLGFFGPKVADWGNHPGAHWSVFSRALAEGLGHWDNHLTLLYGVALGAVFLWYLMLRRVKK